MPMKERDAEALRQALTVDWHQIQRHLTEAAAEEHGQDDPYAPYWTENEDGTKTLHFNPDSWWLRDYDERHVIFDLGGLSILHTQPFHADSVSISLRAAYAVDFDSECDDCFTADHIKAHINRFPAGQFAAQRTGGPIAGNCVGIAVNTRTSRPPTAPALPWREAIGDMTLSAHEPDGDWIYGVEMAVHPDYRGHGIATHLHIARFALAQALNLRGIYMVGMLMGYREHAEERNLSVHEYGMRVMAGDIKDPTVSFQINRGFHPIGVVENYTDEADAGDAGVLLVWQNEEYSGD